MVYKYGKRIARSKRNIKKYIFGAFASLIMIGGAGFPALAASNEGTDHIGPIQSTSPDNGCAGLWATDTFDREFTVHNNGNGTFLVREEFKHGSFVTTGPASPGSICPDDPHHGALLKPGITGDMHGFLAGIVTSTSYNPAGCSAADCSTLQGFLTAVFATSGSATFTCNLGYANCDFNFEYNSSDQSLQYHHWQDKSDNHNGEQFIGDIANE